MSSVSTTANASLGAITNQTQYNAAYTQFLSMLTTELQNQDPTSPMDATQFTNQLVGFSQLEQQLQTNSNLQTLIADQSSNGIGGSLGFLGHTVLAPGNSFEMQDGASTTVHYSLASAANSATMTVTDSNGQVVDSFPVAINSGANSVTLDGETPDGTTLAPGDYTYNVTAQTASGQAVAATTYTSGVVTGIDTSSGTAVLYLGDLQVQASSVVQIAS